MIHIPKVGDEYIIINENMYTAKIGLKRGDVITIRSVSHGNRPGDKYHAYIDSYNGVLYLPQDLKFAKYKTKTKEIIEILNEELD